MPAAESPAAAEAPAAEDRPLSAADEEAKPTKDAEAKPTKEGASPAAEAAPAPAALFSEKPAYSPVKAVQQVESSSQDFNPHGGLQEEQLTLQVKLNALQKKFEDQQVEIVPSELSSKSAVTRDRCDK